VGLSDIGIAVTGLLIACSRAYYYRTGHGRPERRYSQVIGKEGISDLYFREEDTKKKYGKHPGEAWMSVTWLGRAWAVESILSERASRPRKQKSDPTVTVGHSMTKHRLQRRPLPLFTAPTLHLLLPIHSSSTQIPFLSVSLCHSVGAFCDEQRPWMLWPTGHAFSRWKRVSGRPTLPITPPQALFFLIKLHSS